MFNKLAVLAAQVRRRLPSADFGPKRVGDGIVCQTRPPIAFAIRLHLLILTFARELGADMDQFISEHWDAIGTFLGGLATGAVGGSLLTLRLTKTNRAGGNIIDQSHAAAGRDIVGGNKSTRK